MCGEDDDPVSYMQDNTKCPETELWSEVYGENKHFCNVKFTMKMRISEIKDY